MAPEPGTRTFYCPECGERLSSRAGDQIRVDGVLQAEHFSLRTRFSFPAELGKYGAAIEGEVTLREGARVEFFCPNRECDRDFTAAYNHELAEIRMVNGDGKDYLVVFNKVYGRQATFVVDIAEHEMVGRFGDHADSLKDTFERPLNFFGAV